ncbi:geranylgeranylglyceryl/heptaprenylglyceryl phosphate synthase [Gillisia sp. M10.2A]|uniref:Geranylgeranylglyceryl phosphate synthase n=1 Tax=Gillisia lutea TaxID=2909668 RepID=A0ABS9EC19_9FLAO|nr:geranylgeranylglyceryl/heptaprenylglyceryl phosphate synthase [Gillisia lutea]MCF4100435.1 geranylgeranylglyceryl/heptaprenylglyceryl phosphate synthase [Gillisia lutea]
MTSIFKDIISKIGSGKKLLAVLIDPDKFDESKTNIFIQSLPAITTHIFIGGSSVEINKTQRTVQAVKKETSLPVILFPGDESQIAEAADALLFLSLLSGRNPEYLIGQQVRSVKQLKDSTLEIIPTGYILIDGGKECAVQRISGTLPISQIDVETIVDTALAGQFSGKQLIYLEAGSGANYAVSEEIISKVKQAVNIPLIVGGGIKNVSHLEAAFIAGADMVVVGTAFETGEFLQSGRLKAQYI